MGIYLLLYNHSFTLYSCYLQDYRSISSETTPHHRKAEPGKERRSLRIQTSLLYQHYTRVLHTAHTDLRSMRKDTCLPAIRLIYPQIRKDDTAEYGETE